MRLVGASKVKGYGSASRSSFNARFNARALSTVSALALAAFMAPHAARAAEATPPAQDQSAQAELEEIVITGSRIIREGYEAPTPLTVLDASTLEKAPVANIAEYVNTLPVFSGSAQPNTAQNSISAGNAGVNTLNLRGIGGSRTLVLLDGQRSVGSILSGGVDVNAFPQQLVSRVEVVTGGASAVYGSDAVGGVANFILDKSYTGVKGEASGGITSYGDGKNYKIGLSAGFPFAGGRGHVLLSGENVYQAGIRGGANGRDWDKSYVGDLVNPNYTATNGQPFRLILQDVGFSNATPGGMIISGPLKGTAFGQNGTPFNIVFGPIIAAPYMQGGSVAQTLIPRNQIGDLDPAQKRSNLFTRIAYDVTDDINVFAQISWNGSRTYSNCCVQFQPGNAAGSGGAPFIKADNAFIPASIRAQMTALGVTQFAMGSMHQDMGPFGSDNERNVNRSVVGANGKFDAFGRAWSWDAYFQNGVGRNSVNTTHVASVPRYRQAIDAVFQPGTGKIICRSTLTNPNDGCVPYNIMGIGVNDAAAINYVVADIGSYQYSNLTQNVWAASLTGDIFDIWAGPVSVAASAEHRTEKVKNISDPASQTILVTGIAAWFAGNYLPINGSFNVSEAAVETVIPLAKGEAWADNWDLSAAARFTHYSSSGNVVTWKVGSTYTPLPDIKIRVTQSRDIRAPNLQELYAAGTSSQGTVFDPFTNSTPTYRGFATGNLNLEPEKADTTGIGVVVQPTFLPGFSASVDWWQIKVKDAISAVGAANVVQLCFDGFASFCPAVTRLPPVAPATIGVISQINTKPVNIALQQTKGLDFEGSYRFALDDLVSGWAGNLAFHGNLTKYIKDYNDNGVTQPTDNAGQNRGGGPPNWRYSVSMVYDADPVTVSLTARALSSGTYNNSYIECTTGCPTSTSDHTTINDNHIPGGFWMDASMSYKFAIGEDVESEAFLNIRNLGNVDPYKVGGTTYYLNNANSNLFDTLGRVFRAGMRFKM